MATNEYTAEKKYARIEEIKTNPAEEGNIRVYCTQYPDDFTFQIRVTNPINPFGRKGALRNMIATVDLSIKDVEDILAYMKAESTRYERR